MKGALRRTMASTARSAVTHSDPLGAASAPADSRPWPMGTEDGLHAILQHRRLLELLQRIEERVATDEVEDEAETKVRHADAARLLGELVSLLESHFAVEVATSFPEVRSQRNSEQLEVLARLDAEHPVLLNAFDEVRRMVGDPRVSPRTIELAFARAYAAFRKHEACENALFLELC
jgi:iron-sulfur cluster repair protein YtfE (RIC family)